MCIRDRSLLRPTLSSRLKPINRLNTTNSEKFLPVLIQDKFENFRKIRDHENNSGWIHISQLSKKKAAITIDDDQLIFNKPSIYSKPFAILKKGRLCKIHKCKDEWCKISVEKYKGWVKKDILWGLL